MSVKIECPNCKQQYSVDDALVGEEVECTACNHVFVARKKEPIKLGKDCATTERQAQSGPNQVSNETTIKRIQTLMELQNWDGARTHCEKALDSDPENPDLYLMLCLIEHKLTDESLLLENNCDLTEDKYYATAIKFSSEERKQQLLDIRSRIQQRQLHKYEFFLRRSMEQNKVTAVSMLSKCKQPLTEDLYFQAALNNAPSEQKANLLHLQEEQKNSTSFLKRWFRKTKSIRKGGLLGMLLGLVFCVAHIVFIMDTRNIDVEETAYCVLLVLFVSFLFGVVLEFLWSKFYKPQTKKTTIALGIISVPIIVSVVFSFISYVIDNLGHKRSRRTVSLSQHFDNTILDPEFLCLLTAVIVFCFIWCAIWYRMERCRKKIVSQRMQDIESEYLLQKQKSSDSISEEDIMVHDNKCVPSSNIIVDHSFQTLDGFHSMEEEAIRTNCRENSELSSVQQSDKDKQTSALTQICSWLLNIIGVVLVIVFAVGSQVMVKVIHKSKYGDLVFGAIILFVILIALFSYGISKLKNKH